MSELSRCLTTPPERMIRPVNERPHVTAILKANDVLATIDWYTRIGFELRGRFPETGDPTWCEVARDGIVLQFLGGETPWPDRPTMTGTIYVYPDSVLALYESIKDHITAAWGPEVREWDTRERTATSSRSPNPPNPLGRHVRWSVLG